MFSSALLQGTTPCAPRIWFGLHRPHGLWEEQSVVQALQRKPGERCVDHRWVLYRASVSLSSLSLSLASVLCASVASPIRSACNLVLQWFVSWHAGGQITRERPSLGTFFTPDSEMWALSVVYRDFGVLWARKPHSLVSVWEGRGRPCLGHELWGALLEAEAEDDDDSTQGDEGLTKSGEWLEQCLTELAGPGNQLALDEEGEPTVSQFLA